MDGRPCLLMIFWLVFLGMIQNPDLVAKWLHNIVFEQARRNQKETIKGFSVLPVHLSMLLKWKKKKLPHFNLNLCINVFLDNYLTR
jgi:hypothetical protein